MQEPDILYNYENPANATKYDLINNFTKLEILVHGTVCLLACFQVRPLKEGKWTPLEFGKKRILRQLREKDRDSNQWKKERETADMVEKVIYSMENKLQGFENIWNTFLECLWKTK